MRREDKWLSTHLIGGFESKERLDFVTVAAFLESIAVVSPLTRGKEKVYGEGANVPHVQHLICEEVMDFCSLHINKMQYIMNMFLDRFASSSHTSPFFQSPPSYIDNLFSLLINFPSLLRARDKLETKRESRNPRDQQNIAKHECKI